MLSVEPGFRLPTLLASDGQGGVVELAYMVVTTAFRASWYNLESNNPENTARRVCRYPPVATPIPIQGFRISQDELTGANIDYGGNDVTEIFFCHFSGDLLYHAALAAPDSQWSMEFAISNTDSQGERRALIVQLTSEHWLNRGFPPGLSSLKEVRSMTFDLERAFS